MLLIGSTWPDTALLQVTGEFTEHCDLNVFDL